MLDMKVRKAQLFIKKSEFSGYGYATGFFNQRFPRENFVTGQNVACQHFVARQLMLKMLLRRNEDAST